MTPQIQARRAIALTLGYDILVAGLSMLLALEARWRIFGDYDARPFPDEMLLIASSVFAVSAALSFFILKIHNQVWRHLGWPDALRILYAAILAVLIFLPIIVIWNGLAGFPRSSLFLSIPIWLLFLFAGRMLSLTRSTSRPLQVFKRRRMSAPSVILVGNEDSLVNTLRDLENEPGGSSLRVLGLIETGRLTIGRSLRGITIYGGPDQIGQTLDLLQARYGAYPWVAAVGDGRSRIVMRQILEMTSARNSEVMSLGNGSNRTVLEPVRPEFLLGRRTQTRDTKPLKSLIEDKHILITGAGGTIGSELVRQSAGCRPAHITLLDSSEYNLYKIDLYLRTEFPHITLTSLLADIRDQASMHRIMATAKPDIVIHAAALKHVPLMEMNPCEAVLTNAYGALNVAKAASENAVQHFVLISTDKAVEPDNVMGATKRLAELLTHHISAESAMSAALVRFGNVLGSSGSVIPLFESQIDRGGPVTVTHPEITRFFMTLEEAAYLVLQAAALSTENTHCATYVLDMGEPVSILRLARSMIRLKGFVPDEEIKIIFTGLRPGDKLYESLTYADEALEPTLISGIQHVQTEHIGTPEMEAASQAVFEAAEARNVVKTLYRLNRLVQKSDKLRADSARESHQILR